MQTVRSRLMESEDRHSIAGSSDSTANINDPVATVSVSSGVPLEELIMEGIDPGEEDDNPAVLEVGGGETPKSKRSSFRMRSLTRVSSLMKAMSFYDVEANFHGEKNMLYDPDVKFSQLGESFWRLDFRPESLTHWRPYRDNLKFLFSLGGEVVLVGGFGLLYIFALASIPYTNESSHYYNPWMIALYYFITLMTITVVIAYGFFVMIYGFRASMSLLWWVVLPGAVVAALPFIFLAAGIEPWFYFLDLIFYLLVGIIFHVSAFIMVKKVTDDKKLGKDLFMAYTAPLALHALVIALYAFVIVPYYRNIENDFVRAIFRIIVHPVVCQLNLTVAAIFCKRYPKVKHQHLTTGVVFGIYVENAMFGRFLIATVGSLQSQLATSAAAGVLDIAIRLLALKREHLVNFMLKRVFKVKHLNFNEAKERAYMGQFNNISMLVEHVSILTVPFLLHEFYKHRYAFNFSYGMTKTPLSELYQSAAVQFGIQFVVHFTCCLFEYLMKVPNILVWKQERKVYLIWEICNFIQIITLIVYCFKTLPAVFFCDSTDPCTCNNSSYFDLSLFFNSNLCN